MPEDFKHFYKQLEGRIAQVDTIYANSNDANKLAFSRQKEGVCHAILVDKPQQGDSRMDELVYIIDSDENSEN